jgi:hypothetical protein
LTVNVYDFIDVKSHTLQTDRIPRKETRPTAPQATDPVPCDPVHNFINYNFAKRSFSLRDRGGPGHGSDRGDWTPIEIDSIPIESSIVIKIFGDSTGFP